MVFLSSRRAKKFSNPRQLSLPFDVDAPPARSTGAYHDDKRPAHDARDPFYLPDDFPLPWDA